MGLLSCGGLPKLCRPAMSCQHGVDWGILAGFLKLLGARAVAVPPNSPASAEHHGNQPDPQ